MVKLNKLFDSFIGNSLFKDKFVLQANYSPETIPHRDEQIEQIARILAPALRGERTSNLFCYGKTGTGKTLSVQYVRNIMLKRKELLEKNDSKKETNREHELKNLRIKYINCKLKKVADTEYRILAELIRKLGSKVPVTGLPTDYVYSKFIDTIDEKKQFLILIFDEIDQTVKKMSDNLLYNLTRLNSELSNAQISIVGISNDLTFLDNIDPRVRSSLGEEEVVFPPYNALQLQNILKNRASKAFKKGVISDGVISKCAAFAAREHGDARRALDLLRVSGELAERQQDKKIQLKHIDFANDKIERDKILDIIETEPKQFQFVLLAIIKLNELKKRNKEGIEIFTGEIYTTYQNLCQRTGTDVLTPRRVSDILAEFDMLGLINARVISKGRQGRTRAIRLAIPIHLLDKSKKILYESLNL